MSNIGTAIIAVAVLALAVIGVFFIDLDQARDAALDDRGGAGETAMDDDGDTDGAEDTDAEDTDADMEDADD